jgi:virginiamycin A acetyltransferase
VAADVPPYAVVVGNPGRVIRLRFPPEIVAELLAIAWWNWDADRIGRNVQAIAAADIDALRAAV